MHIAKKLLSVSLAMLMTLGTIAVGGTGFVPAASAADAGKAVRIVTNGAAEFITGAQTSAVWFGNYKQSSDGENGFNVDPIQWRVLSNADGRLFLLSDQNLDAFTYHKERISVSWETSAIRQWLNGLNDYSTDSFKDGAFSDAEYAAIAVTDVQNAENSNADYPDVESGNDTRDKVFLLSVGDVQNTSYGFMNVLNDFDTARISTNTAYTASGGQIGSDQTSVENDSDMWWLRNPGYYDFKAASVYGNGYVLTRGWDVDYNAVVVRPAVNIDLNRVLFASAAEDGKHDGALAEISGYTGSEWKLTVLDDSRRGFTASCVNENDVCTITYSGATTGEHEMISAMIVDGNGAATYYGTLCEAETGENTVTVDVSGKLCDGDTLYVFNEQLNGNKKTDYSSALIDVNTEKAIRFTAGGGAESLAGAQQSSVWFGNYAQSDADSKEPVKWRVLSNADGRLFLLSDQNLDVAEYNEMKPEVTWETCDMRKWLNGLGSSGGFKDDAFTAAEYAAVAVTDVANATNTNPDHPTVACGNDTQDKVFLLSIAETRNTAYGFSNSVTEEDTARRSTNTAYVASGGKLGKNGMNGVGEADFWWLRSPGDISSRAALVLSQGNLRTWGIVVDTQSVAVRPALNVDLSKVLLTSAAVGGKQGSGALKPVGKYTGSEWKLTVLDDSRSSFTASVVSGGDVRTITYSGATTGTNEMISAMIVNAEGVVTYYGALCEAETGENTITVNVAGKLLEGDTLYVFNEQLNGDKKTDYASEPIDVTASCAHVWNEPTWDWTDINNPKYSTTCTLCDDGTASGSVQSTPGERVEATVESNSYIPYTAIVTLGSQTFTDTYPLEIPGSMNTARQEAFNAYKEAQMQAAEDKRLPGDSDACKQLIDDAIDAIENVTYDMTKTLQQNKDAVDAAANFTQLDADLAEHRAIHYAQFYADGVLTKRVPYTIDTESITEPAVPDKPGHTGAWPDYVLKAGGVRIDAVYEVIMQTVDFDPNGGKGEMESVTTAWGSKITLPECGFKAPNGKEFDTWDAGNPGDEVEVKSDLTVKALWKEAPLTLTADVDPTQTGGRIAIKVPYAKRGAIAATLSASEEGVLYESSKPDVVSVDENGTIRLEKLCLFCRTATITAYSANGEKVASCVVNVKHAWWQYIIWLLFGSFWF